MWWVWFAFPSWVVIFSILFPVPIGHLYVFFWEMFITYF
jgi:hypothetical protein